MHLKKIVKSHECLEQEVEKLSTDDQNIKEIKSKVASVLEACANQQQVSREVYMVQNKETGTKDFRVLPFTIGRIYKCSICEEEFGTNKERKAHVLTVHKYQLAKSRNIHMQTLWKRLWKQQYES